MKVTNPHLKPGQKQVIVVGGGFGGLNAAQELANHENVQVLLIDERNYHLFQPLLYQVATAGLNPSDIAVPIRSLFTHSPNVSVHLGRIAKIDLASKTVIGEEGTELSYDYLILACGVRHSYFGKPEWENFAPGLKTLEQATEIRRRVLSAFELAENEPDPEKQKALLTFVIVGAGPTGVELAGAIADISRTVLTRDFRRIDPSTARVILLEALPKALTMFSEDLSRHAAQDLKELGVDLRLNVKVDNIDEKGVVTGQTRIDTKNVFWAAGVQAGEITKELGVELDKSGRVVIAPDLTIPKHPEVYVVGDLASLKLPNGKPLPGLAQAAIQTGRQAAKNILRTIEGKERKVFDYNDKGQMATIGRSRAIVQMKKFKMTGYLAWLAWVLVHVLFLVGFKNKVAVLFEWVWAYLFRKRGARLITSREWRFNTKEKEPKPALTQPSLI